VFQVTSNFVLFIDSSFQNKMLLMERLIFMLMIIASFDLFAALFTTAHFQVIKKSLINDFCPLAESVKREKSFWKSVVRWCGRQYRRECAILKNGERL
jgi:hypothetical protein